MNYADARYETVDGVDWPSLAKRIVFVRRLDSSFQCS
jgi:hypothetical protein